MTPASAGPHSTYRRGLLAFAAGCLALASLGCGAGLAESPASRPSPGASARSPLISTVFALPRSRTTELYLDSIVPGLAPVASARLAVNGHDAGDAAAFDARSGRLAIDLRKVGGSDRLQLLAEGARGAGSERIPIVLHEAASGNGESVRVLLIGDSITNRSLGAAVRDKLVADAYRPEFIGTILGKRLRGSPGPGVLGEGREGWAVSDFVHAAAGPAEKAVLGPDQDETARYKGADDRAKVGINPFLRPADPGDDRALVRNGAAFDFGRYLERFDLPAPDVVVIGLGTNDIRKSREAAPDLVSDGLSVLCKAIRKAAPRARIGIWMPAIARTEAMDRRWQMQLAVIDRILAWHRQARDARIDVIPVWAQMDRDAAWLPDQRPDPRAPAAGGDPEARAVRDPIHPAALGIDEIAESLAAYIADAAKHGS